MAQSIASSQRDVGSREKSSEDSQSNFSRLWLAILAKASILGSSIWRFRYVFRFGGSGSLDIDEISARLNVENRAEFDGRNELPPSAEEGLSGTQREIVVYFRELQRKAQHRVTGLAEKLHRLGDDIDLVGVGGSLRDIPSRCENRVFRLIAESHSQLNLLADQEAQQQQYYSALMEEAEQTPGADRSISPVLRWVFLVALISIGTLAIAKSSVPGFGTLDFMPPSWAISISLIVVLVATFIARIFSHLVNHAGKIRQSTNWFVGGLGIAVIVVLAFFAAHYVAAVTFDPTVSIRGVVDAFLADPNTMFTGFADWKTFSIIAAAGFMAFLLGYRQDDFHPGQDGRQRVNDRTRRKRDRLTKRLRGQINAIIDKADAEVTELPKRLKIQICQYSKLVDESKRIPSSLGDYDVALEDGCNILLDRYRATNINARETEAPMSFLEHVCFRPESEPDSSVFDKELVLLEQFHKGIAEIEKDAAEVRQKLRDLNSRTINTLGEFAPNSAD